MNQQQFKYLSFNLCLLANTIPLHWGSVQNNRIDDKIDMFSLQTYRELEDAICELDDYDKNYLRRRWYLWKCSQCDEYLFYKNEGVLHNPNPYDKSWDICIKGYYNFDIKGTVIPYEMRNNVENILYNPLKMVEFFYEKQSKGRRFDIQNRLFLVHHSFVEPKREIYLRCAWGAKDIIYHTFCERINDIQFLKYDHVTVGIIFILERVNNRIECIINGLN